MLHVHSSYLHNNHTCIEEDWVYQLYRTSAKRPKSFQKRRKQFSVLIIGEKKKGRPLIITKIFQRTAARALQRASLAQICRHSSSSLLNCARLKKRAQLESLLPPPPRAAPPLLYGKTKDVQRQIFRGGVYIQIFRTQTLTNPLHQICEAALLTEAGGCMAAVAASKAVGLVINAATARRRRPSRKAFSFHNETKPRAKAARHQAMPRRCRH